MERVALDYFNISALRGFLAGRGGHQLLLMTDHEVVREVILLLESGRAKIAETTRAHVAYAGGSPVPSPPVPPPEPSRQASRVPARSIKGQFDRGQAKCGDEVVLVAQTVNVPDASPVSFQIKESSGVVADTITATLSGASARSNWIPSGAIGPAPRWRPDERTHVMAQGLVVPREYYWDFRDWVQSSLGEKWSLLSP